MCGLSWQESCALGSCGWTHQCEPEAFTKQVTSENVRSISRPISRFCWQDVWNRTGPAGLCSLLVFWGEAPEGESRLPAHPMINWVIKGRCDLIWTFNMIEQPVLIKIIWCYDLSRYWIFFSYHYAIKDP